MGGHIVVAGSINMDLVVRSPRHPAPGETVLGSSFQTFPGGKGANQAVAAARLGAEVKMIGRVGADAFGAVLLDTLRRDQVDTGFVQIDSDAATGVALITVADNGQNTIVVVPGANGRVTPHDIVVAGEAFSHASVLLLQLECPLPAVAQAIALARKHAVSVVLNPAPAQPLSAALLVSVDYLVPNQIELGLLAGMDSEETVAAAAKLQQQGAGPIIVTLGELGVAVFGEGGERRISAYPVQAIDTTAAGDAFVGAFAVALAEGRALEEAIGWGNAAGALAVTRAGAQPSLPVRAEVEQFLAAGVATGRQAP